jgi:ATP-dependent Lhr-like helicase
MFFPRDSLSLLWRGPDPDLELTEKGNQILEFLEENGASFFRDIYDGTGGEDPEVALSALWDLVWSGHATNDTLEPLRAYGKRRSTRAGRRMLSSKFPAHAAGRWSLIEAMIRERPESTERHAAWAQLVLDRHGVVARPTALAENYPGGFTNLYPIYSHLEETGRIRRGYFVEGLGGSQFALPGAVDLLRSESKPETVVLSATDPANPYGGILRWPESPDVRLARDAGAYVVLHGGELIGYLDKGRRGLTLFDPDSSLFGEVSGALADVASRFRRLTLMTVNGSPAPTSPLAPALTEWGFATAPRGLTYRG